MSLIGGLYVSPRSGWYHAYRFILRASVQEAIELRFSTMYDAECYAKRHNLKLVDLDGYEHYPDKN